LDFWVKVVVEESSLISEKKKLKKTKYWQRNGGFTFSPEVIVYLLIDSPMARMQSTETIFAEITCTGVTN